MPTKATQPAIDLPFAVGERVIDPLHGMCEILAAEEQEILGTRSLYYVLKPEGEAGVLKIPVSATVAHGVRRPLSRRQLQQLLHVPMDPSTLPHDKPHQRFKAWIDLLRTGDAEAGRRVLWEAQRVQADRKLSPQEVELRERVSMAFHQEVQAVMGLDEEQTGRFIEKAVAQAPLVPLSTCPM